MNMDRRLKSVLDVLDLSPIRTSDKNSENKTLFLKEEIDRTNEIYNVILIKKENLINPIKIVLMGEVKAGKSTLLNALVGQEISYMNVVEATASILEVKYGSEFKATVSKKNGEEIKYISIEQLNALLDSKRNDMDFFDKISKIIVELPLERLKEITIVDTPGLNTITVENAERTENYILNSDLILWVINAHHLGQSDVTSKINEIRRLGKPILCVVNRVDEIECDKEELLEYVQSEMGYMFKKVFALSSRQALTGALENKQELLNISGFNDLNIFILTNIERNSEAIKKSSIEESIVTQIIREINIHKYYLLRLEQILNGIVNESKGIHDFQKTLMLSVKDRLNQWINYEFFSEERKTLLKSSNLNKDMKMYINEDYINRIINDKYNELSLYIFEQWKMYGEKLTYEKKQSISESISFSQLEINLSNSKGGSNDTVEGCVNGLTAGSAIGLGLAGYAAWLGPAAAYVTIGTAISAFIPPLLITGAIGGAVMALCKRNNRGSESSKKASEIEKAIVELRKSISSNSKESLENYLTKISEAYMKQLTEEYKQILSNIDMTFDDVGNTIDDIYTYLENIKSVASTSFHIKEDISIPKRKVNYSSEILQVDIDKVIDVKVIEQYEIDNNDIYTKA